MKQNKMRNTLLFLNQLGFSDKTLSTIVRHEEDVLEVIYDRNHPFHNKFFDLYTEKEKHLSLSINSIFEFNNEFTNKMNEYKNKGIKILYKYGEDYPHHIFPEDRAPLFLYCYGNQKLLNKENKKVSIIGTRKSSLNGEKRTRELVRNYVKDGWITVSGLAKGIDAEVHKETLKFKGKTIAVLPTTFDKIYPAENKKIFEEIISNDGLAITTIGPFENTYKSSFLDRNTIVAYMCSEVVVIEASIKSGTLNTLRQAYNFDKKIYYDKNLLSEEVINYIKKFGAFEYTTRGN